MVGTDAHKKTHTCGAVDALTARGRGELTAPVREGSFGKLLMMSCRRNVGPLLRPRTETADVLDDANHFAVPVTAPGVGLQRRRHPGESRGILERLGLSEDDVLYGRAVAETVSGLRLGWLGYGAAHVGNLYRPMTDGAAWAVLETAWESGIRDFDTAPH